GRQVRRGRGGAHREHATAHHAVRAPDRSDRDAALGPGAVSGRGTSPGVGVFQRRDSQPLLPRPPRGRGGPRPLAVRLGPDRRHRRRRAPHVGVSAGVRPGPHPGVGDLSGVLGPTLRWVGRVAGHRNGGQGRPPDTPCVAGHGGRALDLADRASLRPSRRGVRRGTAECHGPSARVRAGPPVSAVGSGAPLESRSPRPRGLDPDRLRQPTGDMGQVASPTVGGRRTMTTVGTEGAVLMAVVTVTIGCANIQVGGTLPGRVDLWRPPNAPAATGATLAPPAPEPTLIVSPGVLGGTGVRETAGIAQAEAGLGFELGLYWTRVTPDETAIAGHAPGFSRPRAAVGR